MKLKYFLFFITLVIVSLISTACSDEEKNMNIQTDYIQEEFVQGFMEDDSKALKGVITKTYDLEELKTFFGQFSLNENIFKKDSGNEELLTINKVNEKFPIECLRKKEYVVYKVSEGGYFYVFWSMFFDDNNYMDYNNKPDNAAVYFTAYFTSLKNASEFDSIKEGVSTAEDVSLIDQSFELTFMMSSGIRSFSLLNDDTILEIMYEYNDHIDSRKDLIVKSKKIYSKESCPSGSCLANIYLNDLPC